jgi:hypothetical protein
MTHALPVTSGGSLSHGVWFVIPVGMKTIRAWGSSASGLELIYVDQTIVSERRTAGRESVHEFLVDGEHYSVTFTTSGRFRTQLDCILASNSQPVKTLRLNMSLRSAFCATRTISSIAAGAPIGLAILFFQLPMWTIIPLVAVVVLIQATAHKYSGIEIEEVDHA